MSLNRYKPMFAFCRDSVEEVSVEGAYGVFDGSEEILNSNPDMKIISRSTLKPLQALNAGICGEEDYWAMTFASHSGQGYHVEQLKSLQAKLGVNDAEIALSETYPMHPASQAALSLAKCAKSKKFHPCYAKHLLYAAKARSVESDLPYTDIEHPLNRALSAAVTKIAPDSSWVYDSCGMPSLSSTIGDYLKIWSGLFSKEDNAQDVRRLWAKCPKLIGGDGRLDTEIISASGGLCLAKEGADGVLLVHTNDPSLPAPWTLLIKIAHGYNASHMGLGLLEVLNQIDDLPSCLIGCRNYLDKMKADWVPADQTYMSRFVR